MARSAAKKGFKQVAPKTTSIQPAAPTTIPKPYKPVPAQLQPFVSTLPKEHFYLVHVDRTSTSAKKQAFRVPVILNLIILTGMCLRLYYAAPIYLSLLITVFKYDTSYAIDPSIADTKDIMTTVFNRTMLFATDYAIFWLLGSWPRSFVAGDAANRFVGPLSWRWAVGVQAEEFIVRRSKAWGEEISRGNGDGERDWGTGEEMTISLKVQHAMRKQYISRTGLALLDKDWSLDYKAMNDAHRFMADGRVAMEDLENIVLVYWQKQWLVWHYYPKDTPARDESLDDPKVHYFRQKLTELGCEDVFYRYIEIVQFESNQPGGISDGGRTQIMKDLREMMFAKGVSPEDEALFIMDIGGSRRMPGLHE